MAKGITRIADMFASSAVGPVGKDPLAEDNERDTSTSAQMEYLRAVQERPLEFHTNTVARQRAVKG